MRCGEVKGEVDQCKDLSSLSLSATQRKFASGPIRAPSDALPRQLDAILSGGVGRLILSTVLCALKRLWFLCIMLAILNIVF